MKFLQLALVLSVVLIGTLGVSTVHAASPEIVCTLAGLRETPSYTPPKRSELRTLDGRFLAADRVARVSLKSIGYTENPTRADHSGYDQPGDEFFTVGWIRFEFNVMEWLKGRGPDKIVSRLTAKAECVVESWDYPIGFYDQIRHVSETVTSKWSDAGDAIVFLHGHSSNSAHADLGLYLGSRSFSDQVNFTIKHYEEGWAPRVETDSQGQGFYRVLVADGYQRFHIQELRTLAEKLRQRHFKPYGYTHILLMSGFSPSFVTPSWQQQ